MKSLRVYFNGKKQSIVFYIGDNLKAFKTQNDCHAYYVAADNRLKRSGQIGSIHLPNRRGISKADYNELVAHEVQHLIIDWILTRARGLSFIRRNEEKIATMTGEIVRKFWIRLGV